MMPKRLANRMLRREVPCRGSVFTKTRSGFSSHTRPQVLPSEDWKLASTATASASLASVLTDTSLRAFSLAQGTSTACRIHPLGERQ